MGFGRGRGAALSRGVKGKGMDSMARWIQGQGGCEEMREVSPIVRR